MVKGTVDGQRETGREREVLEQIGVDRSGSPRSCNSGGIGVEGIVEKKREREREGEKREREREGRRERGEREIGGGTNRKNSG